MALLTKDALLGASDLREREIDLPTIGGSVRVRGLPAAYSNQAISDAFEMVTGPRGEQTARVSTEKLQALQVLHGLIDPKLNSLAEVELFAQRCGPAFTTIVSAIADLSGVDQEAIKNTTAMFQSGGAGAAGPDVGAANGSGPDRSDLSVRAGA